MFIIFSPQIFITIYCGFTWYLTRSLCPGCRDPPDAVVSTLFWTGYANSALNPVIGLYGDAAFTRIWVLFRPQSRHRPMSLAPKGSSTSVFAATSHRATRQHTTNSSTPACDFVACDFVANDFV